MDTVAVWAWSRINSQHCRFTISETSIKENPPCRGAETVLEAKREEFGDDALIYAKSLCGELEISLKPPRRIRRKHIFGDGSKAA
ncbi:hypothetical protein TNCV_2762511 [Trichonephila clavipes]|nr:hypothetical protein TNCV_2762511 [Trichonephila clavipes]